LELPRELKAWAVIGAPFDALVTPPTAGEVKEASASHGDIAGFAC
jgi:hypothetical protein